MDTVRQPAMPHSHTRTLASTHPSSLNSNTTISSSLSVRSDLLLLLLVPLPTPTGRRFCCGRGMFFVCFRGNGIPYVRNFLPEESPTGTLRSPTRRSRRARLSFGSEVKGDNRRIVNRRPLIVGPLQSLG